MKFLPALTVLFFLDGDFAFTSNSKFSRFSTRCNSMVEGIKISGGVKATNNFVLVKVADALEESEGGILLTGKTKIQKTEGKIVNVGPGKTHPETGEPFEIPVESGENVVYGKYDGTALDIDGVKHTLIRDDDILIKFAGDELTLDNAEVIRDNILVDAPEQESTEGGLLLTKSSESQSKPSTGTVLKVGPGRFPGKDMNVSPGDSVKFMVYAGNEVEIEGKEYSVVKMTDILAKF